MSQYTTGELARKCGVSVRTVQYYDERGILVPTALTEGGRRLFSDEDLSTLKTICFLRDLDISIKDIAEILTSEESKKIIGLLIDQQTKAIQEDIRRKTEQLEKIRDVQNLLTSFSDGSPKTLRDISAVMEAKEKKKKVMITVLCIMVPVQLAQLAGLIAGIIRGIWTPFFVLFAVNILCGAVITGFLYRHLEYICPECHTRYQPGLMEMLLANHTLNTRKLTCPRCKRKIWSLEVYKSGDRSENQ